MGSPHFFCYMDTKKIQAAVQEILTPVVEGMGYELLQVRVLADMGRTVLRLTADKPGGITLDDCARLSREISPHLDVADVVPYAYNLEVSSPGLRRPLTKPSDFERYKGQEVYVTLVKVLDGRRRFKGKSGGLDEKGRVTIEADGHTFHLPWDDVTEARLDPELPFGPKPAKGS